MRRIALLVALGFLMLAQSVVHAGPIPSVAPRQGDNTIYFTWDAQEKRIVEASSSRQLTAGQQVELLTRLTDRTGAVDIRGVLKNVSSAQRYRVSGRLVQRIYQGSDEFRVRRSKPIDRVLAAGEKVGFRFSYGLASGSYSVRTDFVRN